MSSDPSTASELGPKVRSLAAGARVFGRYEMVRKLGEGGFGAVWLANDTELNEEVALKFVLQAVANSPEAADALKREAARSRKLTHPNIVRIHDFIAGNGAAGDEDLAAVSMEFVNGQSLGGLRLTKPGRHFTVAEVAPWVAPLCQALAYAHDPKRRVIHRDLKPANVLLADDGELKIADFGIACSLVDSVSQISGRRRSGTPAFMSPQQVDGDFPSESDDLYSLGATLFTLLTGTPPFNQGDLYSQIKEKRPSTMTERLQRLELGDFAPIPPEWEETVAACLEKEPARRPQSALAIAARLGLHAGPVPVPKAKPAGPIRVSPAALSADFAPTEKAAVPVPRVVALSAGQGKEELDLAALLELADTTAKAKKARGADQQPKSVRVPKAHLVLPEFGARGRAARARKRLLIAGGVALLALAIAATGFLFWRSGRVEGYSRDLAQERKDGHFAEGQEKAAKISGLFRNQKPLKTEIERTVIAAELDGLRQKTFSEASTYLTTNQTRLASPAIQNDAQLQERVGQLRKWAEAGEALGRLGHQLRETSFRAAGAESELGRSFSEMENAVAELDPAFQPDLTQKLAEAERTFILHRLEWLEQAKKEGARPVQSAVASLGYDATRFDAPAEVRNRIAALYGPAATTPAVPAATPRPTPKPAVAAKPESPGELLSLPTKTTYLATWSGAGYDLSNVEELRLSSPQVSRGNMRLFRPPEPILNPTNGGLETVLTNGKLYDGGNPLIVWKAGSMTAFDEKSRESLKDGFGLLFNGANGMSEKFYIYFGPTTWTGNGLVTLPAASWLKWNQKAGVLTLRAELGQALARLKSANHPTRQFLLRAQGLGELAIAIRIGEPGQPWPVNLALPSSGAPSESTPAAPVSPAKSERVLAAKAARDLLMGSNDRTRFSELGMALFDRLDNVTFRLDPLASTANYSKTAKLPGSQLRNGRTFVEYTQALLAREDNALDVAIAGNKAAAAKATQLRGGAGGLDGERNELYRQKAAVETVLREFAVQLQLPGLHKPRLEKIITLWTGFPRSANFGVEPGKSFRDNWEQIFTAQNIAQIRPFLEWGLVENGDGDLDQEIAKIPGQAPAALPSGLTLAAMQEKLRNDFPSLGPFSIDLNDVRRVVSFTGSPATTTEPPPPFK